MKRALLLFTVAMVAAACASSSTTLDNAAKLATAGQATSRATVAFLEASADAFDSYGVGKSFAYAVGESEAAASAKNPPKKPLKKPAKGAKVEGLPATCNDAGLTPLTAAEQADADTYFTQLKKARGLYVQLGRTYGALNALAAYDIRPDVEKSLGGTVSAANGLLKVLKQPELSADAGALVSTLGGAVAQNEQARLVLQSSARIRVTIEQVRDAMFKSRVGFTGIPQQEAIVRWQVASTLWCVGLVDPHPLLGSLVRGTGLTASNTSLTAKDPLADAVRALFQARTKVAANDPDRQFDQLIDGLDEIIEQHRRLETGKPVDTGRLVTLAADMDALAKTLSGESGK